MAQKKKRAIKKPNAVRRKAKRPYHFKHSRISRWWQRYKFKHTTMAFIAVILFVLVLDTALVKALLLAIEESGYIGIFVTGALFVSFFTAAPATIILLNVANDYNPFLIAAIAGAGSVLGDWLILKFFEDNISYELRPVAKKYGIMPIIKQMRTKKFRPIAIIIAMILIATPSPDEAGLALLGLTKTPLYKLIPIIYLLNISGIFLLVMGARAFIS